MSLAILARLCPESAYLNIRKNWCNSILEISCGLVDAPGVRFVGYSEKEAVKRYREKFGLQGVRLRRVSW